MWDRDETASQQTLPDDRFTRTVTLDWAEVRDDYFQALRKISLPFFDLGPINESAQAGEWLTRSRIQQMFAALLPGQLRLFD
jgi:hypothetical protein